MADERETIGLMDEGRTRGKAPMRARKVDKLLRNGPLTDGQKAAVKLILSERDRVVGVQGYAGTGKTTMLNRARALLAKRGYELKGLAPSASAAQTLAAEANIETETLQRFLVRNAGVAEGRLTRKGRKNMRAAFAKTVLVVDEGSLASTVQTRNLLRIARELRLPRVVLVGDGKQLDAVDAGKPFVQLQNAGMKTATMDRIMRQKDADLKAAVEASLAGDIKKAFQKLGPNVVAVKPDNLPGAAAARWLQLSPEQRENTGLMAPSHALRVQINEIVRNRLIRDGHVAGPALNAERLVSRGYTHAEKTLAANYAPGDVVAFHRPYKRLGVEKGDELRVAGVDRKTDTVHLTGKDGNPVIWAPNRLAARTGGAEVYRSENMELRQGDRIRWTRNDKSLGLVNSQTADVTRVENGTVTFSLEDGRVLELEKGDSQLRHIDRGLGIHGACFPGPDGGYRDRGNGSEPSAPHHAEDTLRRNKPGAPSRGTGDRRPGHAPGTVGAGDRRANRSARSGRARPCAISLAGEGARNRRRESPRSGREGESSAGNRARKGPRGPGAGVVRSLQGWIGP